MNEDLDADNNY